MILVLDTNVLVSALLRPDGPPGRVLDLFLSKRCGIAYDDRILREYREVLPRPKFGFTPSLVEALLEVIDAEGLGVAAPPVPVELPDPDDQAFLEVAVAIRADALVTGNLRHYPVAARRLVPVTDPAAFLRSLRVV